MLPRGYRALESQPNGGNRHQLYHQMVPVRGYSRNTGSLRDEYGTTKLKSAGRKLKKILTGSLAKDCRGAFVSYDENPMDGPWDTSSFEEEYQLEQILGKHGVTAPDQESSELNEISMHG